MTSEILHKINTKSKQAKFQASRDFKRNTHTSVPFEEVVVLSPKHPDSFFLVHKNMVFDKSSLCDSSYNVFSFDKEGNYKKTEDVKDLGREFFRTMKVLKKL
jgi:hypothetical protein